MLKIIGSMLLIFGLCCFIAVKSYAIEYLPRPHHSHEAAIEKAYNSAIPAAAGQHHYKATTQLQWSVGAAFAEGGDSAVSLGLGLQLGEVFASGNYSTDGDESIVGVAGSGTF